MDTQQYQQLKELSWRQRLSSEDQTRLRDYLSSHADAQRDWETEAALTHCLGQLRATPVASNFTARVLHAAKQAPAERVSWTGQLALLRWPAIRWMRRCAMASVILSVGLVSLHEYRAVHRAWVASELVKMSQVANLPELECLKDFDTINRLPHVQVADNDLLIALK